MPEMLLLVGLLILYHAGVWYLSRHFARRRVACQARANELCAAIERDRARWDAAIRKEDSKRA